MWLILIQWTVATEAAEVLTQWQLNSDWWLGTDARVCRESKKTSAHSSPPAFRPLLPHTHTHHPELQILMSHFLFCFLFLLFKQKEKKLRERQRLTNHTASIKMQIFTV